MPMSSWDHEDSPGWEVDALGSVSGHHDDLHVAVDDVEQLVSVGVHLPTRSALRAVEASGNDPVTVELGH
jgi:hypothetical protein